jgi:hypothetical protein
MARRVTTTPNEEASEMSVESESDQPNEYGFAGGATAPEPEPTRESAEEAEGESIAVPSGDITGALSDAVEDMSNRDDDRG